MELQIQKEIKIEDRKSLIKRMKKQIKTNTFKPTKKVNSLRKIYQITH